MSQIEKLQAEVARVSSLINEANGVLKQPASHLSADLKLGIQRNASHIAPRVAIEMQKAFQTGKRPDALILLGIGLGVAYVGAKVVDGVRNGVASSQARKNLTAYYQELAVKQNLLVTELTSLMKRLAGEKEMLTKDRVEIENRCAQLEKLIERIAAAQTNRSV